MKEHSIATESTLREALVKLNALSGRSMTLMAIDSDGRLAGTLTDGDIRRVLIAGASLDSPVAAAMMRNFSAISDVSNSFISLRQFKSKGIRLLPATDADGRPVRLIDLEAQSAILPLSALIMAGGRGERLRPLTENTPKPLIEIGGKAIIDYNVEALLRMGITDITVSARYLSEQIIRHFSKPVAEGVTVKCVVEEKPLGTIGALNLVKTFPFDNILVTNSDLLTTISYEDMLMHHISQQADITIATINYTQSVPYAILTTEGSMVTGLEEKPNFSYYANAGIYIISRRAAGLIAPGERIDATDLISRAINRGLRVTFFPVNGTWIDVGSHADLNHARELMKHHRHLSQ